MRLPRPLTKRPSMPLRIFSAFVAATLLVQDFGLAAIDLKHSDLRPSGFSIPQNVGIVKEAVSLKGPEIIVNVKDMHDNFSAQESIVQVLENLVANYDVKTIGVEGSSGPVDTSLLAALPYQGMRKNTADFLMKEGRLSAGEFFSAMNDGKIAVYGMDDQKLYEENLAAFKETLKCKAECFARVKVLRAALAGYADDVFSEDLALLEKNGVLVNDGSIKFSERWKTISSMADRHGVRYADKPNIQNLLRTARAEKEIDFKKAASQRDALLDVLGKQLPAGPLERLVEEGVSYKLGRVSQGSFSSYLLDAAAGAGVPVTDFAELRKYADYMLVYETLDIDGLKEEIRAVEDAVRDKIYRDPDERALHEILWDVSVLSDLMEVKLSSESLAYFKAHRDRFTPARFRGFLDVMAKKHGAPAEEADLGAIFGSIPEMVRFYESAEKRNEALLANTIRRMRENGERVACLVTGGFHSRGIAGLMKERQISHIVIMPRYDKKSTRPYLTIITSQTASLKDYAESEQVRQTKVLMTAHFFAQVAYAAVAKKGALTDSEKTRIVREEVGRTFSLYRGRLQDVRRVAAAPSGRPSTRERAMAAALPVAAALSDHGGSSAADDLAPVSQLVGEAVDSLQVVYADGGAFFLARASGKSYFLTASFEKGSVVLAAAGDDADRAFEAQEARIAAAEVSAVRVTQGGGVRAGLSDLVRETMVRRGEAGLTPAAVSEILAAARRKGIAADSALVRSLAPARQSAEVEVRSATSAVYPDLPVPLEVLTGSTGTTVGENERKNDRLLGVLQAIVSEITGTGLSFAAPGVRERDGRTELDFKKFMTDLPDVPADGAEHPIAGGSSDVTLKIVSAAGKTIRIFHNSATGTRIMYTVRTEGEGVEGRGELAVIDKRFTDDDFGFYYNAAYADSLTIAGHELFELRVWRKIWDELVRRGGSEDVRQQLRYQAGLCQDIANQIHDLAAKRFGYKEQGTRDLKSPDVRITDEAALYQAVESATEKAFDSAVDAAGTEADFLKKEVDRIVEEALAKLEPGMRRSGEQRAPPEPLLQTARETEAVTDAETEVPGRVDSALAPGGFLSRLLAFRELAENGQQREAFRRLCALVYEVLGEDGDVRPKLEKALAGTGISNKNIDRIVEYFRGVVSGLRSKLIAYGLRESEALPKESKYNSQRKDYLDKILVLKQKLEDGEIADLKDFIGRLENECLRQNSPFNAPEMRAVIKALKDSSTVKTLKLYYENLVAFFTGGTIKTVENEEIPFAGLERDYGMLSRTEDTEFNRTLMRQYDRLVEKIAAVEDMLAAKLVRDPGARRKIQDLLMKSMEAKGKNAKLFLELNLTDDGTRYDEASGKPTKVSRKALKDAAEKLDRDELNAMMKSLRAGGEGEVARFVNAWKLYSLSRDPGNVALMSAALSGGDVSTSSTGAAAADRMVSFKAMWRRKNVTITVKASEIQECLDRLEGRERQEGLFRFKTTSADSREYAFLPDSVEEFAAQLVANDEAMGIFEHRLTMLDKQDVEGAPGITAGEFTDTQKVQGLFRAIVKDGGAATLGGDMDDAQMITAIAVALENKNLYQLLLPKHPSVTVPSYLSAKLADLATQATPDVAEVKRANRQLLELVYGEECPKSQPRNYYDTRALYADVLDDDPAAMPPGKSRTRDQKIAAMERARRVEIAELRYQIAALLEVMGRGTAEKTAEALRKLDEVKAAEVPSRADKAAYAEYRKGYGDLLAAFFLNASDVPADAFEKLAIAIDYKRAVESDGLEDAPYHDEKLAFGDEKAPGESDERYGALERTQKLVAASWYKGTPKEKEDRFERLRKNAVKLEESIPINDVTYAIFERMVGLSANRSELHKALMNRDMTQVPASFKGLTEQEEQILTAFIFKRATGFYFMNKQLISVAKFRDFNLAAGTGTGKTFVEFAAACQQIIHMINGDREQKGAVMINVPNLALAQQFLTRSDHIKFVEMMTGGQARLLDGKKELLETLSRNRNEDEITDRLEETFQGKSPSDRYNLVIIDMQSAGFLRQNSRMLGNEVCKALEGIVEYIDEGDSLYTNLSDYVGSMGEKNKEDMTPAERRKLELIKRRRIEAVKQNTLRIERNRALVKGLDVSKTAYTTTVELRDGTRRKVEYWTADPSADVSTASVGAGAAVLGETLIEAGKTFVTTDYDLFLDFVDDRKRQVVYLDTATRETMVNQGVVEFFAGEPKLRLGTGDNHEGLRLDGLDRGHIQSVVGVSLLQVGQVSGFRNIVYDDAQKRYIFVAAGQLRTSQIPGDLQCLQALNQRRLDLKATAQTQGIELTAASNFDDVQVLDTSGGVSGFELFRKKRFDRKAFVDGQYKAELEKQPDSVKKDPAREKAFRDMWWTANRESLIRRMRHSESFLRMGSATQGEVVEFGELMQGVGVFDVDNFRTVKGGVGYDFQGELTDRINRRKEDGTPMMDVQRLKTPDQKRGYLTGMIDDYIVARKLKADVVAKRLTEEDLKKPEYKKYMSYYDASLLISFGEMDDDLRTELAKYIASKGLADLLEDIDGRYIEDAQEVDKIVQNVSKERRIVFTGLVGTRGNDYQGKLFVVNVNQDMTGGELMQLLGRGGRFDNSRGGYWDVAWRLVIDESVVNSTLHKFFHLKEETLDFLGSPYFSKKTKELYTFLANMGEEKAAEYLRDPEHKIECLVFQHEWNLVQKKKKAMTRLWSAALMFEAVTKHIILALAAARHDAKKNAKLIAALEDMNGELFKKEGNTSGTEDLYASNRPRRKDEIAQAAFDGVIERAKELYQRFIGSAADMTDDESIKQLLLRARTSVEQMSGRKLSQLDKPPAGLHAGNAESLMQMAMLHERFENAFAPSFSTSERPMEELSAMIHSDDRRNAYENAEKTCEPDARALAERIDRAAKEQAWEWDRALESSPDEKTRREWVWHNSTPERWQAHQEHQYFEARRVIEQEWAESGTIRGVPVDFELLSMDEINRLAARRLASRKSLAAAYVAALPPGPLDGFDAIRADDVDGRVQFAVLHWSDEERRRMARDQFVTERLELTLRDVVSYMMLRYHAGNSYAVEKKKALRLIGRLEDRVVRRCLTRIIQLMERNDREADRRMDRLTNALNDYMERKGLPVYIYVRSTGRATTLFSSKRIIYREPKNLVLGGRDMDTAIRGLQADTPLSRKVRAALGAGAVLTEQSLEKAIETVSTDPSLYQLVDTAACKPRMDAEGQALLARAEAGGASLASGEIERLNRSLMGAVFPPKSRQVWAIYWDNLDGLPDEYDASENVAESKGNGKFVPVYVDKIRDNVRDQMLDKTMGRTRQYLERIRTDYDELIRRRTLEAPLPPGAPATPRDRLPGGLIRLTTTYNLEYNWREDENEGLRLRQSVIDDYTVVDATTGPEGRLTIPEFLVDIYVRKRGEQIEGLVAQINKALKGARSKGTVDEGTFTGDRGEHAEVHRKIQSLIDDARFRTDLYSRIIQARYPASFVRGDGTIRNAGDARPFFDVLDNGDSLEPGEATPPGRRVVEAGLVSDRAALLQAVTDAEVNMLTTHEFGHELHNLSVGASAYYGLTDGDREYVAHASSMLGRDGLMALEQIYGYHSLQEDGNGNKEAYKRPTLRLIHDLRKKFQPELEAWGRRQTKPLTSKDFDFTEELEDFALSDAQKEVNLAGMRNVMKGLQAIYAADGGARYRDAIEELLSKEILSKENTTIDFSTLRSDGKRWAGDRGGVPRKAYRVTARTAEDEEEARKTAEEKFVPLMRAALERELINPPGGSAGSLDASAFPRTALGFRPPSVAGGEPEPEDLPSPDRKRILDRIITAAGLTASDDKKEFWTNLDAALRRQALALADDTLGGESEPLDAFQQYSRALGLFAGGIGNLVRWDGGGRDSSLLDRVNGRVKEAFERATALAGAKLGHAGRGYVALDSSNVFVLDKGADREDYKTSIDLLRRMFGIVVVSADPERMEEELYEATLLLNAPSSARADLLPWAYREVAGDGVAYRRYERQMRRADSTSDLDSIYGVEKKAREGYVSDDALLLAFFAGDSRVMRNVASAEDFPTELSRKLVQASLINSIYDKLREMEKENPDFKPNFEQMGEILRSSTDPVRAMQKLIKHIQEEREKALKELEGQVKKKKEGIRKQWDGFNLLQRALLRKKGESLEKHLKQLDEQAEEQRKKIPYPDPQELRIAVSDPDTEAVLTERSLEGWHKVLDDALKLADQRSRLAAVLDALGDGAVRRILVGGVSMGLKDWLAHFDSIPPAARGNLRFSVDVNGSLVMIDVVSGHYPYAQNLQADSKDPLLFYKTPKPLYHPAGVDAEAFRDEVRAVALAELKGVLNLDGYMQDHGIPDDLRDRCRDYLTSWDGVSSWLSRRFNYDLDHAVEKALRVIHYQGVPPSRVLKEIQADFMTLSRAFGLRDQAYSKRPDFIAAVADAQEAMEQTLTAAIAKAESLGRAQDVEFLSNTPDLKRQIVPIRAGRWGSLQVAVPDENGRIRFQSVGPDIKEITLWGAGVVLLPAEESVTADQLCGLLLHEQRHLWADFNDKTLREGTTETRARQLLEARRGKSALREYLFVAGHGSRDGIYAEEVATVKRLLSGSDPADVDLAQFTGDPSLLRQANGQPADNPVFRPEPSVQSVRSVVGEFGFDAEEIAGYFDGDRASPELKGAGKVIAEILMDLVRSGEADISWREVSQTVMLEKMRKIQAGDTTPLEAAPVLSLIRSRGVVARVEKTLVDRGIARRNPVSQNLEADPSKTAADFFAAVPTADMRDFLARYVPPAPYASAGQNWNDYLFNWMEFARTGLVPVAASATYQELVDYAYHYALQQAAGPTSAAKLAAVDPRTLDPAAMMAGFPDFLVFRRGLNRAEQVERLLLTSGLLRQAAGDPRPTADPSKNAGDFFTLLSSEQVGDYLYRMAVPSIPAVEARSREEWRKFLAAWMEQARSLPAGQLQEATFEDLLNFAFQYARLHSFDGARPKRPDEITPIDPAAMRAGFADFLEMHRRRRLSERLAVPAAGILVPTPQGGYRFNEDKSLDDLAAAVPAADRPLFLKSIPANDGEDEAALVDKLGRCLQLALTALGAAERAFSYIDFLFFVRDHDSSDPAVILADYRAAAPEREAGRRKVREIRQKAATAGVLQSPDGSVVPTVTVKGLLDALPDDAERRIFLAVTFPAPDPFSHEQWAGFLDACLAQVPSGRAENVALEDYLRFLRDYSVQSPPDSKDIFAVYEAREALRSKLVKAGFFVESEKGGRRSRQIAPGKTIEDVNALVDPANDASAAILFFGLLPGWEARPEPWLRSMAVFFGEACRNLGPDERRATPVGNLLAFGSDYFGAKTPAFDPVQARVWAAYRRAPAGSPDPSRRTVARLLLDKNDDPVAVQAECALYDAATAPVAVQVIFRLLRSHPQILLHMTLEELSVHCEGRGADEAIAALPLERLADWADQVTTLARAGVTPASDAGFLTRNFTYYKRFYPGLITDELVPAMVLLAGKYALDSAQLGKKTVMDLILEARHASGARLAGASRSPRLAVGVVGGPAGVVERLTLENTGGEGVRFFAIDAGNAPAAIDALRRSAGEWGHETETVVDLRRVAAGDEDGVVRAAVADARDLLLAHRIRSALKALDAGDWVSVRALWTQTSGLIRGETLEPARVLDALDAMTRGETVSSEEAGRDVSFHGLSAPETEPPPPAAAMVLEGAMIARINASAQAKLFWKMMAKLQSGDGQKTRLAVIGGDRAGVPAEVACETYPTAAAALKKISENVVPGDIALALARDRGDTPADLLKRAGGEEAARSRLMIVGDDAYRDPVLFFAGFFCGEDVGIGFRDRSFLDQIGGVFHRAFRWLQAIDVERAVQAAARLARAASQSA